MNNMPTESEIAKAVQQIQERDGVCTPAAFVAEAKDDASPLHTLFSWDDKHEAQLWREHRARQIIGRVRVTINGSQTPAYVSVKVTTGGECKQGYIPVEVAMSDNELRAQVFADAHGGLSGWRRRLTAFTSASEVCDLLDSAIEKLAQLPKQPGTGEQVQPQHPKGTAP